MIAADDDAIDVEEPVQALSVPVELAADELSSGSEGHEDAMPGSMADATEAAVTMWAISRASEWRSRGRSRCRAAADCPGAARGPGRRRSRTACAAALRRWGYAPDLERLTPLPLDLLALARGGDVGQLVEAGVPELVDVEGGLGGGSVCRVPSASSVTTPSFFSRASASDDVEVDVDAEGLGQVPLDPPVDGLQVARIEPRRWPAPCRAASPP